MGTLSADRMFVQINGLVYAVNPVFIICIFFNLKSFHSSIFIKETL